MGGKRARVLVVDDDEDMTQLVAEVLGERGLDVVCCPDADHAMAALDDADAVVTDVNLARQSGLELCGRITAERPALPVVVISGDHGSKGAALRHGAAHFMVKPIDVTQLCKLLVQLIGE